MRVKGLLGKMVSLMLVGTMVVSLAACGNKGGNSETEKGTEIKNESGYKIGWSTIYLTPSWMQQTKTMMEERIGYWKQEGVVSEFTIANANGDTSQQIAQIENLISQDYDAIVIIAGSSTALNNVIDKAYDKGIKIINIDSLVSTEKVTSKINTSQYEYGELVATWLVETLGGKGSIIAFNGPAGVSVADERWEGAKSVLDQYPDMKVVANLNAEYNEGPALSTILPALDANPDIDGILSLGGSQSSAALKAIEQKGMDYIPITGENYNVFLKEWARLQEKGFSSYAVGQPNWLGVLAVDQAIRALNGEAVDAEVIVPIPVITDDTLAEFVPNDFPDDGYPVKDITQDEIDKYLEPKK